MPPIKPASRRWAVALLFTLLVLALLIASVAHLATVTSVQAISQERESHTLGHELAVQSLLRVVALKLQDADLQRLLDRQSYVHIELDLETCLAAAEVRDD